MQRKYILILLVLILNILVWLPFAFSEFPVIGRGHDNQLYAPAMHASLRSGNMPWDLMTRNAASRVDIFSYPYFSIIYPFYWTLGIDGSFTYDQHLMLDTTSVIFHMVVASLMFAWFLSRVGCRTSIAAFGGIAYAYSLHIKMWSTWIWAISAYTWIPLCLLGIWEVVVEKRQRRGILYLGVGFGMISLATGVGLVYALVLCAAFALACWFKESRPLKPMLLDVRSIVVGGLLGAGIGAAHLLPVISRMHDYIRWYSGGVLIGKFKPPYEATLSPALDWPYGILQLLVPLKQMGGTGHLYLGAGLVMLSLLLLVKNTPWKRFAIVLWAVSIYFLFDAFGDATFIHRITYEIPLINSIRYPTASMAIPVILLTLMGCVALEQFLKEYEQGGDSRRPWALVFYFGVLLSILGLYFVDRSSLLLPYQVKYSYYLLLVPGAFSIVAIGLAIAMRNNRWLALLPLFVLFSYLPQYSLLFHPKVAVKKTLYNQCNDFVELYEALGKWKVKYPENARLTVHFPQKKFDGCLKNKKFGNLLAQSLAMMAGWNVMQSHFGPRPYLEFKQFSLFSSKALRSHTKLLQGGISHVLTTYPSGDLGKLKHIYQEKERIGSFVLYEIKDWIMGQDVAGCIVAKVPRQKIVTAQGERFIELPPGLNEMKHPELRCNEESSITEHMKTGIVKKISGSDIHYIFETARPLLFVSDRVMRDDWVVRVNGKKVKPARVDGYRMALTLGSGHQEIDFLHRPADFRAGLVISLLGIFVSIWLVYCEWMSCRRASIICRTKVI